MKNKHTLVGMTLSGMPLYKGEDYYYIRLKEIYKEYKNEFHAWMEGQTVQLINGEMCINADDWEQWYDMNRNV